MEEIRSGYVYAYITPQTSPCKYGDFEFPGEPYYIGLSGYNEFRMFHHLGEAESTDTCNFKLNKIRKLIKIFGKEEVQNNIIVVKNSLTRDEAIELEIKLIELIGRRDLNTGPLTNLTIGGDGAYMSIKAHALRGKKILEVRSPRSCYSYDPEYSKKSVSESMTLWFDQNRNKTFVDLPELKYRRYYSNSYGIQGGGHNGNSCYYYLVITDDGGYHLASRGCMRQLAKILGIAYTTIECSARDNENRIDGKFTRIMRGSGYGSFAFRFKSLKECPVNITMGNQHPSFSILTRKELELKDQRLSKAIQLDEASRVHCKLLAVEVQRHSLLNV